MAENNIKLGVYNLNGEDFTFNFKTSLSAIEKVYFVNSVTESLIDDNYNYVLKDLIFDFYIVDVFCIDFDMSDIFKSESLIENIENLLDETNIVDIIKANVDADVISELRDAVDLNIEYRTGIHINPISSSFANLLDTLNNKFSGFDLDKMMEIADPMSKIAGELTPEKMLDAYAKTNIFKEHWDNSEKNDDADNKFSVVDGGGDVKLDSKSPSSDIE